MGAKFTEKETEDLRISMMQMGFRLLKEGGIRAVNIDEITRSCYVAKGTFYNLFKTKAEFLYQVMIFKRQESKNKILDFLGDHGKLSRGGLMPIFIGLPMKIRIFFLIWTNSIFAGWCPSGRPSIWKMKVTTKRQLFISYHSLPARRKTRTGSYSVII